MRFVKHEPHLGYVDTMLYVPKCAVNVDGVKSALTFCLTDKMGAVRYLQLWDETDTHIIVPRALWSPKDLEFEAIDCRPQRYPRAHIESRIVLDAKNPSAHIQKNAVKAVMASSGGVLQLGCGQGKTVTALHIASLMGVPTLIVVDNNNLMNQWTAEIEKHLTLLPDKIGQIQGDVLDWRCPIVMSTYQTLANRAATLSEEVRRWFGLIIWDECHHSAAPVFCKSVSLFYGFRLGLTATPDRTDGSQIVYASHMGKVLFKHLRQELTPKFQFIWTGLALDMTDPSVINAVVDKNKEVHLSKLATYMGKWPDRLHKILALVRQHESEGRKTMVLSNTVGELVNLLALYNGETTLYSDLTPPTPTELGYDIPVTKTLHKEARARLELELKRSKLALFDKNLNASKREHIKTVLIPRIEQKIASHEVGKEMLRKLEKAQREYIKNLVRKESNAGLMIAKVPTDVRMQMLRSKKTVFTIYRYGIEGLDDADLDTIIAAEPMTSKNVIQQFVGRILRKRQREKFPLVQFLEDDIGPYIGMCRVIRRVLREWPIDEGGPYRYELVGHPYMKERKQWRTGQSSFLLDGST